MQKMEYDMGKINGKDAQSEGNRMVFVHGLNSSKLEEFDTIYTGFIHKS